MDRSVAVALVVALIGVLAVASAAATLTSVVEDDAANGGGGSNETGILPDYDPTFEGSGDNIGVPPLVEMLGLAVLIVASTAVLAWSIFHFRKTLKITALLAVGAIGVVLLVLLLNALAGGLGGPGSGAGIGADATGDELIPGTDDGTATQAPTIAIALAALVLMAAGITFFGVTDDREDDPVEETTVESGTDADGIGAVAGRAADRIERTGPADESVDNEVYRAWREMTDRLSVANPATSTPQEFAVAAVDAGMAEEDVRELTALFEAVRYGGADADDREQRAVTVLRRIEFTYGESDRGAGDSGGETRRPGEEPSGAGRD